MTDMIQIGKRSKEAQRILAEWESGEKTEESFAEMAMQYSTDPGSNTNGGLYEDVYPGMMVTEFNDWCFAEDRNVADYGIIKTSYGYHIMYMSGVSDELYWKSVVKEAYLNEQASALLDEICARYPVTSDLSNAPSARCFGAKRDRTASELRKSQSP